MLRKLLIASQKGGVGKTTTAINLSTAAALSGAPVLLVDTDPVGSVAASLNLHNHADKKPLRDLGLAADGTIWHNIVPGLDIIQPAGDGMAFAQPMDDFLKSVASHPSSQRYQWLVIDSPPIVTGDLLRKLIFFSDNLMLIIRAEPMSYRTLPMFLQLIKSMQSQGSAVQMRGILLTMPPGETAGRGFDVDLRHIFGRYILPQTIPYDEEVPKALLAGRAVISANPRSPAAVQYHTLAQWLGMAAIPQREKVNLFGPAEPAPVVAVPNDSDVDLFAGGDDKVEAAPVTATAEYLAPQKEPDVPPAPAASSVPKEAGAAANAPALDLVHDQDIPNASASKFDWELVAEQAASRSKSIPGKGHAGDITSVSFSTDGKVVATASWDKTIKLWNVASGEELLTLSGHGGVVSYVLFADDGNTLATASWDKTVYLWRLPGGEPIGSLKGHTGVVTSLAYSPDGSRLASCGWDKTVRLWEVRRQTELKALEGHERMVTSVAYAPNGLLLASGSWDKTVRLWEPSSGKTVAVLKGHSGDITSVAFSRDGKTLASGSLDHSVKLWDMETKKERATLRGHGGEVTSVAFSRDGRFLATASWDRTVKLWNFETGELRATLQGHNGVVTSIAFAPDSRQLASCSLDHTVKIWDLETGRLLNSIAAQAGETKISDAPQSESKASVELPPSAAPGKSAIPPAPVLGKSSVPKLASR
ncbi:MAG TPA: AAA family ATPase, partial [Gemmataceae bacterium]|nr:AAA family ATPase [Gemmataceae bacterium]